MNPIIDATALAAELAGDRPPLVLDATWSLTGPPGILAYRAGHVPGALFIDFETVLSGTRSSSGAGGRHPLPGTDAFQADMRAAGVGPDRDVVTYDAGDGVPAARAWWLLRYFGHDRVRVLDGGLAAWRAAGFATEEGDGRAPEPGAFTATPGHLPTIDADTAQARPGEGVLLDARAPERFRGEKEPVDPVAGHIPGARNSPVAAYTDEHGRLRSAEELREYFAGLGVRPGTPVAAYCGSGGTAAHTVLALGLAGIDAELYPGSWSDWVSRGDRPVATGG